MKIDRDMIVAHGLIILRSSHRFVRRLKRRHEPTIHGNKFWRASYLLMDYLYYFPPEDGVRVMEIGCGWGLAGIYCAKHFDAEVTAVDADEAVFPYLEMHAIVNEVEAAVVPKTSRFERLTKAELADKDVLLGGDICFWDSMVKPLFNLIRRARQAGVGQVVITDPGRSTFFELADKCEAKLGGHMEPWWADEPRRVRGYVLLVPGPDEAQQDSHEGAQA